MNWKLISNVFIRNQNNFRIQQQPTCKFLFITIWYSFIKYRASNQNISVLGVPLIVLPRITQAISTWTFILLWWYCLLIQVAQWMLRFTGVAAYVTSFLGRLYRSGEGNWMKSLYTIRLVQMYYGFRPWISL